MIVYDFSVNATLPSQFKLDTTNTHTCVIYNRNDDLWGMAETRNETDIPSYSLLSI